MDLLDGGSDLSDFSDAPPPTPGPVMTPLASPSTPLAESVPTDLSSPRRSSARDRKGASKVGKSAPPKPSQKSQKSSSPPVTKSLQRNSTRGPTSSNVASDDLDASAGDVNDKSTPVLREKFRQGMNDKNDRSGRRQSSPQAPMSSESSRSEASNKRAHRSGVRHSSRKQPKSDPEPIAEANDHEEIAIPPEDARKQPNLKDEATASRKGSAKRMRSAQKDGNRAGRSAKTVNQLQDENLGDDDEEDDQDRVRAPQRKRKKVMAEEAFFSDEDSADEEMQDLGTDEEDDYSSESDGETRSKRVKGPKRKLAAKKPQAASSAVAPGKASVKLEARSKAISGQSKDQSLTNKAVSSEAKMRASIDAAKDKTTKTAAAAKFNPKANSFRPGVKTPVTGASTPVSGAKATPTANSTSKKGPQAFGKSMSGWDQLFGSISGLASSTPSTKSAQNKPTPSQPVAAAAPATGIRPDPELERASTVEIAKMRTQQNEAYFNTDQCFDLLAHAEIMLAFEQDAIYKDRKTASLFRPSRFGAGNVRHTHNST